MFEMPKRTDRDGRVGVQRDGEDAISVEVVDYCVSHRMTVGRYNAARLLVMLCVMLEVPTPKALNKMPM